MVTTSDLNSVSTQTELDRLFEDIYFSKKLCEQRLERIVEMADPAPPLADLESAKQNVQNSLINLQDLNKIMSQLSEAGATAKSEIMNTLTLYNRALEVRTLVQHVTDLRALLQGIYSSINLKDYVRAAELCHKTLRIPSYVFESSFANRKVPNGELPDSPQTSLNNACELLGNHFKSEFQKAANSRDSNLLSHYFKLFPLVNRRQQGLELYAKFMCQIVAGMSRNLLESSKGVSNPVFYSTATTKLLENIASLITQHSPLVLKNYGLDAMPKVVIPIIQTEVDKQAGILIDTLWDERKIEFLVDKCRNYSYPELVKSFTNARFMDRERPIINEEDDSSLVDLADASNRLNELSIIFNRWALYKRFLQVRWQDYTSIQESLKESSVQNKIDDLLSPVFSTFSLFVFRRSFEKSVVEDELPNQETVNNNPVFTMESPIVSSVVDDVLYVYSNVLGLSFDTGDLKTIQSSFSGLRRVLESDFMGTMQRKLKASSPNDVSSSVTSSGTLSTTLSSTSASLSLGTAGSGANDGETYLNPFMVYLNNVKITDIYVTRCIDNLLHEEHSLAPQPAKEMVAKFKSSYHTLSNELVLDGCRTLASQRVNPQARTLFNSIFKQHVYTQLDTDYSRNGSVFETQWRKLIKPLKQLLHKDILLTVLNLVCQNLSSLLEKFVWSLERKIAQNGVIMLDHDIHKIVGCVQETDFSLKKQFSKILQISETLLEFDENMDLSLLSDSEIEKLKGFKKTTS